MQNVKSFILNVTVLNYNRIEWGSAENVKSFLLNVTVLNYDCIELGSAENVKSFILNVTVLNFIEILIIIMIAVSFDDIKIYNVIC